MAHSRSSHGGGIMTSLLLIIAVAASSSAVAWAAPTPNELLTEALDVRDWIVGVRRELHGIPELGFKETKTAARISSLLKELGIPHE
jgi:hypothetical protein